MLAAAILLLHSASSFADAVLGVDQKQSRRHPQIELCGRILSTLAKVEGENTLSREMRAEFKQKFRWASNEKGAIRIALDYVKSENVSANVKANDLNILFTIIKPLVGWTFRRIPATDGGDLFIGPGRHAIFINAQGRIYKGRKFEDGVWRGVPRSVYWTYLVWTPNYDQLEKDPLDQPPNDTPRPPRESDEPN